MDLFGIKFMESVPNEVLYFAVLAIVIVLLIKFLPKKKDYPRKDIDIEAPKEFADMIKTSGVKTFSEKFMLFNGPIKLGRITAFTPWHFDSDLSMRLNLKKNKEAVKLRAQVKDEFMVDNFYLFEVIKDTPIHKILYAFGRGKNYHLVDQRAVSEGYRQYLINLYMQPQHYFKNVYIYSKMSKAIALNIADRLTLKATLNGVINFIPKMDYIEMKTANYAAKAREFTDIKDKSWKKREESLEKESEPG